MSKLKMNTEKLVEVGEEIKEIAKEYNLVIEKLYNELTSINKEAWVSSIEDGTSGSVNAFLSIVLQEKENIQTLLKSINDFGVSLNSYSNDISAIADNTI